jgi:F-type H+-transporting ATPase subunit c
MSAEAKERGNWMRRKLLWCGLAVVVLLLTLSSLALAGEVAKRSDAELRYFGITAASTAFGLAIAAIGGALSQSRGIRSALEGIARNPGASGTITTAMIIGLALIESLVIYVLVVCLILLIVNPFGI